MATEPSRHGETRRIRCLTGTRVGRGVRSPPPTTTPVAALGRDVVSGAESLIPMGRAADPAEVARVASSSTVATRARDDRGGPMGGEVRP